MQERVAAGVWLMPQAAGVQELTRQQSANRQLAAALCGLVVAMGGLAYASVPLYQLFCRLTGYGGTVQQADSTAVIEPIERLVTVRFDASVNGDLDWEFVPPPSQEGLRLGQVAQASYRARSLAGEVTHGTSLFNVAPAKAGLYFNKIECFCFIRQSLSPGQSSDFRVAFYVDPALADDPDLAHIDTITLSYTFYQAGSQQLNLAAGTVGTQKP